MEESGLVPFPTAQHVNSPACSPHCPASSREAVNTNILKVIGLTLGIKPKSTAPEADALTTQDRVQHFHFCEIESNENLPSSFEFRKKKLLFLQVVE